MRQTNIVPSGGSAVLERMTPASGWGGHPAHPKRFRGRPWILGRLMVPLLATGLAACGSQPRSAAAVCHVWNTDGAALHNQWNRLDDQVQANPGQSLGALLLQVISAPNDVAVLMEKLEAVAPESIEPDFQAVASLFKQEASAEANDLSHPLSGLVSGLMGSLEDAGSVSRVNSYLETQCAGS